MTAPRKVALVTGASSGIGRATALHLAEQGWRVSGQAAVTALSKVVGLDNAALDHEPMAGAILRVELGLDR